MKAMTISLLLVTIFCCHSFAQNERLSINGNENINEVLPDSVKFQYPAFMNSMVYLKDGTDMRALLNYNYVVGQMQFIDPKSDTLSIANEGTIKSVTINSDTFCYDKVWLQVVATNGKIKLAKRQIYTIGDIKKVGAYGQLSSTGGISIVNSLTSQGRVSSLTEGINTTLIKKVVYYIGDSYNHFLVATKKNCFKIFGNKENALQNYFAANKVDFFNEADLKRMINMLGEL